MDDMEAKLGAILSNPDMMAQIMNMAQALGGGNAPPQPPTPPPPTPPQGPLAGLPEGLDIGLITKLAGMANSAKVDQDQRALLLALHPYLAQERIIKLEKAMRATKLASLATSILSSGILTHLGR